ncbi:hypothetical protein UlMin_033349 [Ulmus minor]
MCSGLKINMNKSSLARISLTEEEVGVLASEVGCEKGSWPMKYLGLPLGGNPNLAEFWNPVIEKVSKRLDSWKKAFLSKGGRLTLIQSVLSSIPTYYMSLFKLPRVVAAYLEKMMREFLWDRDSTGKGRSLVRWKTVCKPKELGGLGIGNLILRNKALLGKWLWRFPLEQHSLWATVIRSKYGLDRNGWDTNQVGIHWAAPASVRGMFLDRTLGYSSNNMAKTLWNCMVFSLLWHIWLERNIRIFEDKEMLLEDIFEKAKFSALQWAFSDKSFKGFPFFLVAFNWKDVIGIS